MIGDVLGFFGIIFAVIIYLFIQSIFFPIPVSDIGSVRYQSFPVMTIVLIFVNSVIFILLLAPGLYTNDPEIYYNRYYMRVFAYGYREMHMMLNPATGQFGSSIGAWTAFTSMFMHADFWHLFGNMMYLWTFGRRIEDACGSGRFFLFYIFAGLVAGFANAALNPAASDVPGIGASGAIAGLMGAYLLLFPGARISVMWLTGSVFRVPLALVGAVGKDAPTWKWILQLPAWFLLISWIAQETLPSLETIMAGRDTGGVANLAHLTGFLAALLIFLYVRKDLLTRYIAGRQV